MNIKFTKTRNVKTPDYGTPGSAGLDFYIPEDAGEILLRPGEDAFIPSGIKVDLPDGYALVAHEKSGVSLKQKLLIGAKVVDSDYTGEIHLHCFNAGLDDQKLSPGKKLTQFLLIEVPKMELQEVDEESLFKNKSSLRGDGMAGSTGE